MKKRLLIILLVLLFMVSCGTVPGSPAATPSLSPTATPTATVEAKAPPTEPPQVEEQGIKYIFYIIGDGMGEAHFQLGDIYNKLIYDDLNYTSYWHHFEYSTMTIAGADSSQGGSMLATGEKNHSGLISQRDDGTELTTILDIAKENGFSTGMVTNASVADATPAAFLGHSDNRNKFNGIVRSYAGSDVDYIVGGGSQVVKRVELTSELINGDGYFETICEGDAPFYYYQHSEKYAHTVEETPTIVDITNSAIDYLDEAPFLLVIEQSPIDGAGHQQSDVLAAAEMGMMDSLLKQIFLFCEMHPNECLIILTADHETGNHRDCHEDLIDFSGYEIEENNLFDSDYENRVQSASLEAKRIFYNAGGLCRTAYHSKQQVPVLSNDDAFLQCQSIADIPHFICDIMEWEDTLGAP